MASLPTLPSGAAYLRLLNATRRNALSLPVIRDLTSQLRNHLRSRRTGEILTLPPFQPSLLKEIESGKNRQYNWLIDPSEWSQQREHLPNVIVLRGLGPVFSSGHDLNEVASMSPEECKTLFDACAELMSLIRRSPAVVVCGVHGLATAAGAQLALTCDITIARPSTNFQLPGMSIGLPCTSPSTAVSRRLPRSLAYRMFATAQPVRADRLAGAVDTDFRDDDHSFRTRINKTVKDLTSMPGQPQAFGKWAFWTQAGIGAGGTGGDGYEEAARWTSTAMTMHARGGEAKEGMAAFLEKRKPVWTTSGSRDNGTSEGDDDDSTTT